jgi:hypothetical protein
MSITLDLRCSRRWLWRACKGTFAEACWKKRFLVPYSGPKYKPTKQARSKTEINTLLVTKGKRIFLAMLVQASVTSKLECAEDKFQTRGWVRETPPTTSYALDLTRNAGPCSKLRPNKVTSKLECAEDKFQTRGWVREAPPTTSYAWDLTRIWLEVTWHLL